MPSLVTARKRASVSQPPTPTSSSSLWSFKALSRPPPRATPRATPLAASQHTPRPPDRALRPRSARCAYRVSHVAHHPRGFIEAPGGKGRRPSPELRSVYRLSSAGWVFARGYVRVPSVCDGRGEQNRVEAAPKKKPGRVGSLAHQRRRALDAGAPRGIW